MLLLITSPRDAHAQRIAQILKSKHIPYQFFSPYDFPAESFISYNPDGQLTLRTHQEVIDLKTISAVWYPRIEETRSSDTLNPTYKKYAESEAASLLESLCLLLPNVHWCSNPLNLRKASHKPFQLRLAKEIGFIIPPTYIGNDPLELIQQFQDPSATLAIKSIDNNSLKLKLTPIQELLQAVLRKLAVWVKLENAIGVTDFKMMLKKRTIQSTIHTLKHHQEDIAYSPTIVQQYVNKAFDLRITVIGNKIFSCAIYSQEDEDENIRIDYRDKTMALRHEVYELPSDIAEKCFALTQKLELDFGCIDMVVTHEGEHIFLEINPDGLWLWVELMTGLPIGESIVELLTSKSAK